MTASAFRAAALRSASLVLLGLLLAIAPPLRAQDAPPKPASAVDALGAQPIGSREDDDRRRREEEQRRAALQKQQQQLDEAQKQDIYKKKLSQEEKLRDKDARNRKAAELQQQRQIDRGLRQGVDPNAKPPARNPAVPPGYTASQAAIDKQETQRRLQQDYLKEQDRKRREAETRQNPQGQNTQRQANVRPRANDPSKKQQDELDKGLKQNPYTQPTRPAKPLTSPGPNPTPDEQKREKDGAKRKWDKEYDDEVQKNNPKKKPQG